MNKLTIGRLCLLFFFFIFNGLDACLQAQIKLSGKIVDKTGTPIPGVRIDMGFGYAQTISDNNGQFFLVYSDTLKNRAIRFEAFSYKQKRLTVGKEQKELHVILIDSVFNIRNIVVSAPKYGRFSDYSAQTIKMSSFDINTNPAANADILGGMRVLPGVQTNDNDGRLIIQGGTSDESQIYINDLPVVNPYGLSAANSPVRSRFSSDLFDGVVLQSGGYNAEFGQALSGIVNLNTKERAEMEAKTDISLSSVFATITHIDQKPSYAYRAGFSFSDLTPYGSLAYKRAWNKYPQQIQADFFLTKEFNSRTKMTAQINFSHTGMEYLRDNIDSIRFQTNLAQTYFYSQVNMYHSITPVWSLSFAANLITDNFSGTSIGLPDDKVNDLNTSNHNKLTLQYRKGRITNRTGMEFIYNRFNEKYFYPPSNNANAEVWNPAEANPFQTDVNNCWTSFYNDSKLFLTNQLTANLGLRGEYSVYLERFNLAPRLYLAFAPNVQNIISASWGKYFQLPTMEYLKLSNNIDFVSVNKATLSYSYVKQNDKFQLDAYYKKYNREITYNQGEYQRMDLANNGKGYAWGVDVFLKNHFKLIEYWLTYSFNQTERQYAWFTKAITPDYVARHSLNATMKYWIAPCRSMLGASYNITSGAPYYSNSMPYEQSGVTPYRNRLDISWSYLPLSWFIVHFSCQNVLGYNNIYGYEYSKINPDVKKAITNPEKRFFFLGVFITLSKEKKANQLKTL